MLLLSSMLPKSRDRAVVAFWVVFKDEESVTANTRTELVFMLDRGTCCS